VRRTVGVETIAVQRGESLSFKEQLSVGPHLVPEAKRRAAGVTRLGTVASQKGGDVPGRERDLAERRGEHYRINHVGAYLRVR
jgi:hypothetical protein